MPVVSPPSRKPHILYAGLALLFLVSATYRALDIAERVGELRHGGEYVREPFDIFVGAAPQHDDMTLMVARCHEVH